MNGEQVYSLAALLRKELVVATGCTEPAAAALAGAAARKALGVPPTRAFVRASRDIIKNALHAGIPHTDLKGIEAAVALGIVSGDSGAGLNALSGLDPGKERAARAILDARIVTVDLAEGVPPVFIQVTLEGGGKRAAARIRDEHDRVEVFDDAAYAAAASVPDAPSPDAPSPDAPSPDVPSGRDLSLPGVYHYAETASVEDLWFLIDGAETNMALAEHSIERGYGIQVGKTMLEERDSPTLDALFCRGASLAAAASDARMAGCPLPVVINSGSGNQGIAVSVPVLTLARGLGSSREDLARALCLAHLTALMITGRKGRLSALCGAFTAATGTAAGFVRLLGGDYAALERCVSNMVGNLIGLLCDGAKGSCALKIYSCVEAAAMGARIALAGRGIPPSEGIVGRNTEENLERIRRIAHEGMAPLDKAVLGILLGK